MDTTKTTKSRRGVKIVDRRLQLIFVGFAFTFILAALLVQGVATNLLLHRLSVKLANDGAVLVQEVSASIFSVLSATAIILLPVVVALGLWLSHRVTGPIYRLQSELQAIAKGGDVKPIRLREKDELQALAADLNAALLVLDCRSARTENEGSEDVESDRVDASKDAA